MEDEFTMSCVDAARQIGISPRALNRKAAAGLVECREKGLTKTPRRFFRPADVEQLRQLVQFGRKPVTC